jgi:hypothetical protein
MAPPAKEQVCHGQPWQIKHRQPRESLAASTNQTLKTLLRPAAMHAKYNSRDNLSCARLRLGA